MSKKLDNKNALEALRTLTLAEVEQRLADLDGERASLSLIRRSLVARDRAKQRAKRVCPSTEGGK